MWWLECLSVCVLKRESGCKNVCGVAPPFDPLFLFMPSGLVWADPSPTLPRRRHASRCGKLKAYLFGGEPLPAELVGVVQAAVSGWAGAECLLPGCVRSM